MKDDYTSNNGNDQNHKSAGQAKAKPTTTSTMSVSSKTAPIPTTLGSAVQAQTRPAPATPAASTFGKPRPIVKFDWPFPNFKHVQKSWKVQSSATLFVVGMLGRTVIHLMNKTKVYNEETMVNAIFKRPAGTPLITYCNHESCMDDPMLISHFFKPSQFLKFETMRWSLAAHDICFEEPLHAKMFSLGKCIPTIRGHGVYQRALDFVIDRLNHGGDWLHIFPEGAINLERKELHRLKWGVGRIISECKRTPIVIPFWHTGMSNALPNQEPYYPRFGKSVVINVGQPLQMGDVIKSVEGQPPVTKRKTITDFLENELRKLREETVKMSHEVNRSK